MKYRIPLKAYLSLHFGTAAVLPVFAIVCLVWFFMMPALQTRTVIQHQAMARSIAGQMSAYLKGGERQLTVLAEYFQNRPLGPDQGPVDLLDAQCGKGEFFEALFVVSNEDVVAKMVGLAQSRRPKRVDFMGMDLSGLRFIDTAKGVKTAVWSETFLSTVSSQMAVALTVPLAGGFITGEITLNKLSEFISQLPLESELLTLIIDGQGLIVADSRKRRWGQMSNLNLLPAEGLADGTIAAANTFELDGSKMLGVLVKIDGPDWNVLVAQPVYNALKPLRETFGLIALGLAITLGLVLSIPWFMAGRLTLLFQTYSERAGSIANGRYDLQWPAAKTREFFQLGQSLKRMAEKISQREKALVDSEKRLKDIVANVPGVVYQYKADPEALESSSLTSVVRERSIEIFGLDTEKEHFFNDFVLCLPEEDQPRFVMSVKAALEAVKPWYHEGRFTKPSGETIWFEGRSVPRRIGDEIVYYGVLTDITQRKEMESSLRLSQFIFDKADIGIFLLGENAEFLNVNEAACRDLGFSQKELCNMSVFDIDTAFTPDQWTAHMADLRNHGVKVIETLNRHKDGTVFPVQVIDNVMTFEDQEFHVAFVQDITERKRTEKSLRLAQFIIDSANIGIYRIAPDGRVREVNQKAAQLLGYTKEELETLTMADVDSLVASETWSSNWQRLVAQGTRTLERQHRKKDHTLIPVAVYSNILDYEGQQYAIAFVQDISERKRIEESLRLTQFIFDEAPIGIWRMGGAGEVLDVNEQGCNSLGYSREELCRMTVFDFAPGFGVDDWKNGSRGLAEAGVKTTEVFHQRKNGEIFPIQVIEKLMRFQGQAFRVAFVHDITQKKQDEEALRRLQNYLSNIIDSMPSILLAVDRDGHVTQWNHQTEKATGLSFEKARCQPLSKVFPRLAGEMERISVSIRERRVISSPKVSRKVEQEIRYEDITIFPLVANGVEGAVIRVDDVTQQVRLEEMMIQSEKMLSVGGLAAGMAHEINNPLAGILQNASVLENRLLGDLPANRKAAETAGTTLASIRHYLALRKLPSMIENIRTSGNLAAAIVKNMLSFARKSEKSVAQHDLASLLDQSIDLLKTDYDMKKHYDFKRVEVVRLYDPAAGLVPCEASKIQQVFMNILKNGAEAMAEVTDASASPKFTLRVRNDSAWVRVEIEDNGPGIDENTRRRIFEPFFTTKPVGKGTGLGLSVSYFIITEDHGGEMGVVAADGGGTCFVIRLPKVIKK